MHKNNIILFSIIALCFGFCACEEEPVQESLPPLTPTVGAINARYSVSSHTTVVFAQGNLQYQASSNTWRFATNQYDIIGQDNDQISPSNEGWIDLFGWGTSGYDEKLPTMTSDRSEDYGYSNLPIAGTDYDWGRYNRIENGGYRIGLWRTLTDKEWEYLLTFRQGASTHKGLATIEQTHGLVLLPDEWVLPASCQFLYGSSQGFATNQYTAEQWFDMQEAGAVFLPAAGYRDTTTVKLVGEYGGYWTSSNYYLTTACDLYFHSHSIDRSYDNRALGQSVRLVQNK